MVKNMSAIHRGLYIAVGAALVALPFIVELTVPWKYLAPVFGVVSLISGGIGV